MQKLLIRSVFLVLLLSAAESSSAAVSAETYFATSLKEHRPLAEQGVAPGRVVGELCDLRHEVWTELREGQTTIVCIYQKKPRRPLGKEQ